MGQKSKGEREAEAPNHNGIYMFHFLFWFLNKYFSGQVVWQKGGPYDRTGWLGSNGGGELWDRQGISGQHGSRSGDPGGGAHWRGGGDVANKLQLQLATLCWTRVCLWSRPSLLCCLPFLPTSHIFNMNQRFFSMVRRWEILIVYYFFRTNILKITNIYINTICYYY